MKRYIAALLALQLSVALALPRNGAAVEEKVEKSVAVAAKKGDESKFTYLDDSSVVRLCLEGECKMMTLGDAKGLDSDSITSWKPIKADPEMTKALSPTISTMSESLKGLQAQKALMEQLEAQMAQLTSSFDKGLSQAESLKGQFAATVSKGVSFDASKAAAALSPMSKGMVAAPVSKGFAAPPSKGFAAPPSKGAQSAAVNYEAALCPMTMYELKKSQKLAGEMAGQLQSANNMNAMLSAQKQQLEGALATSEALKAKAQAQSAFNAKYAAEQKSKADMLAMALAQANAENAALKQQKEVLEGALASTQAELADSRAQNEALTQALGACTEEKEALQAENEGLRQDLAVERDAREECEIALADTQQRLAQSEEDLAAERTAREQTEEELMKTMTDLSACQGELESTANELKETRDELTETTQQLAAETAARQSLQDKLDSTTEELKATQEELRDTQRALEQEQFNHAKTQRQLEATQQELEATEAARQQLEEAKQLLEDELAETKDQLEVMTAERDQLQVTLDATSAALAQCSEEKMTCQADLAQEKAITAQLSSQLTDAMMMLEQEKKAREELTATIYAVKEASMKLTEELKRLQIENVQLQQQIEKLKSEQETALAMAAGCPPTYEKFGLSCYKYVREKTQWKMAQEQCMKDSGNLVSVESREEQAYLVDFLKRHGAASSDGYSLTSGNKRMNHWKWLGSSEMFIGQTGPQYWYNEITKMKPNYDCQAMYLGDSYQYGKWVGLPCYSSAPFVCEFQIAPPGSPAPANPAEYMAQQKMLAEAPAYLSAPQYTKGSALASKGNFGNQFASKGFTFRG